MIYCQHLNLSSVGLKVGSYSDPMQLKGVSDDINGLLGRLIAPAPEFFLERIEYDDPPNQAALERWFHGKTLDDLLRFSDVLDTETSGVLKMFGKMCISACLRPLSSQTRSWGHIADNVFPKCFVEKIGVVRPEKMAWQIWIKH